MPSNSATQLLSVRSTIIFDGVDDRGVGRQEKVGAGGFSSFGSAIDGVETSVRVRCGFRGVRVGEASNPGPPERVRPRGEEVGEVDRLEHELTLIDLDEEPLLRVGRAQCAHQEDGASVSGTPLPNYHECQRGSG